MYRLESNLTPHFFPVNSCCDYHVACSAYVFRFPLSGEGFTYLAVKDFIDATLDPIVVPSPSIQGVASVFEGVQEAPVECCYG